MALPVLPKLRTPATHLAMPTLTVTGQILGEMLFITAGFIARSMDQAMSMESAILQALAPGRPFRIVLWIAAVMFSPLTSLVERFGAGRAIATTAPNSDTE